jgi:hypothetical protein
MLRGADTLKGGPGRKLLGHLGCCPENGLMEFLWDPSHSLADPFSLSLSLSLCEDYGLNLGPTP